MTKTLTFASARVAVNPARTPTSPKSNGPATSITRQFGWTFAPAGIESSVPTMDNSFPVRVTENGVLSDPGCGQGASAGSLPTHSTSGRTRRSIHSGPAGLEPGTKGVSLLLEATCRHFEVGKEGCEFLPSQFTRRAEVVAVEDSPGPQHGHHDIIEVLA